MWGFSTQAHTHQQTRTRIMPEQITTQALQWSTQTWCATAYEPWPPPIRQLVQQGSKADKWVFHCLAQLNLRGKQPHDYVPDWTTFNARRTHDRTRPGLELAPWCTGGPPACSAAERARNDPRAKGKNVQMSTRKQICASQYYYGILCQVQRGLRRGGLTPALAPRMPVNTKDIRP